MKQKNSLQAALSETQSSPPTREAIDYRETGAVGRRPFVRKIGIAGALLAPVLAVLVASSAMAQNVIVVFKGGIGVIPVSSLGVANVVDGIQPPGEPWRIFDLTAWVRAPGHIHVDGRGLLLAGATGSRQTVG